MGKATFCKSTRKLFIFKFLMYLDKEKEHLMEILSKQFVKRYPEVKIPYETPKIKLDYTTWRITTMPDLIYNKIMKEQRISKAGTEPLSIVIKEFKLIIKKLKSKKQLLKPSCVQVNNKKKLNRTMAELMMDPTVRIAVKKLTIFEYD